MHSHSTPCTIINPALIYKGVPWGTAMFRRLSIYLCLSLISLYVLKLLNSTHILPVPFLSQLSESTALSLSYDPISYKAQPAGRANGTIRSVLR